jgi:hypothetical protein
MPPQQWWGPDVVVIPKRDSSGEINVNLLTFPEFFK